jgi:muramoyltetrapeptide carboxypeptidase LdcA involved in peptidoglycan recycling
MMRDYESTLSNPWYTIEDMFDGYDFPVIGNALFGHISPNFPLILGRTLTIDTYARNLSIAGLSREMKDTHQS